MENKNVLNFEDSVEALKINGDENKILKFNPTSMMLLKNIEKANAEIVSEIERLDADETLNSENKFEMMDTFVKAKIDEIFGAGTSEMVFGSDYSIVTVKGNYVYENFLIAIMNYMTARIKEETELSQKRVQEYTKKAEELKK